MSRFLRKRPFGVYEVIALKDDKKKLMIVGALALIVVAVGAFQLMGGGGSPRKVAVAAPPKPKLPADIAATSDAKINPFAQSALPKRDPFQAGTLAGQDATAPVLPKPQPVAPQSRRITGNFETVGTGEALPSTANAHIVPLKPEEPPFGYQLVGVITGPKPAAVFQDSTGGQRLVQAGSSVDGDSRVLSIRNGEVRVQFKDKTLRLKPGGNPSGK